MRFYLAALTVMFVLSLNGVAAHAVEYDQNIYLFHEGNNDPTTESNPWTLNSGTNPAVVSSGPGTETIGANTYDYWFTADNGTASGQTLNYRQSITAAQALNPWTYRARLRSVGTTSIDQMFAVYDGTHRWGVWIQNGSLHNTTVGEPLLANVNMATDYRELEMLYKPITPGATNSNDLLEIYIEQSLVASYTRSSARALGDSSMVWFGGNSSGGTGQINWNRIEMVEGASLGFAQELPPPAPEPGTLSLLGLALVGMLRRKRCATA